jgi:phytoene dehydrogenase-like protein
VVLDVGPRALLRICGDRVPPRYRRALERFRHGPGTFKLDWALAGPIPWARPELRRAGTVHLGGTLEQIALSESEVARGRHPTRPYVLLAQQSLFDPGRLDPALALPGTQAAWAYCHVPAGSTVDMTARIEAVVEEAAPGFGDLVVARHTMDCAAMERHDANYVGGDITGGSGDLRQILTRPTVGLHPWRTPMPGIYLCSSSTPPGAGVHGMCGLHAARTVLADLPG